MSWLQLNMWLVNTFTWKWKYLLKWNNAFMHWRWVLETHRNSWCVLSGPPRSKCQEGIRCGRDLLGKVPKRENVQGARGSWESQQTTVQVKSPWRTEEGVRTGQETSFRLECNSKKVSAEPMGSPQYKITHHRNPLPSGMALPACPCWLRPCLGATHWKCGPRGPVVKDSGHYGWGTHDTWVWHTIY